MGRKRAQQTQQSVSYAEYCEMIRVEMEQAASVTLSAETKMEELRSEKDEVVLHARHFEETAYFLNVQLHKQSVINERLRRILDEVTKELGSESQKTVTAQKQASMVVSDSDVHARIREGLSCYHPFPVIICAESDDFAELEHVMQESDRQDRVRRRGGNGIDRAEGQAPGFGKRPKKSSGSVVPFSRDEGDTIAKEKLPHRAETNQIQVGGDSYDGGYDMTLDGSDQGPGRDVGCFVTIRKRCVIDLPEDGGIRSACIFPHLEGFFCSAGKTIFFTKVDMEKEESPIPKKVFHVDSPILTCTVLTEGAYGGTLTEAGELILWDSQSGKTISSVSIDRPQSVITRGLDKHSLFIGYGDNMIGLLDVRGRRQIVKEFSGHTDTINSIVYSPTDSYLVGGSKDGTVCIWDARKGPSQLAKVRMDSPVNSVDICPRTSWASCGLENGGVVSIHLPRTNRNMTLVPPHGIDSVTSLHFNPENQWLLGGTVSMKVSVWKSFAGPSAQVVSESFPISVVRTDGPIAIACSSLSPMLSLYWAT